MIVGFIGLGTMGRNAALNLKRAGFDMVVYDVRPEALAPLTAKGAKPGASPADVLARCDVTVTMVSDRKRWNRLCAGRAGSSPPIARANTGST